jgi:hypothetical protein
LGRWKIGLFDSYVPGWDLALTPMLTDWLGHHKDEIAFVKDVTDHARKYCVP